MATATSTGFTGAALEALAEGPSGELRRRAFEQFEALPLPSPETEEWRYTDVRGVDLAGLTARAEEPPAANLDEVGPGVLAAAGDVGDRAGLAVQHNSSVVMVHLASAEANKGVVFCALDDAPAGELTARLHQAVPTLRTKFTALHGAFRTGGTFVHVPAGVRVEAPLQTLTYVDRDGVAVFPHTVLVAEEGAEVTFIDRYVSPDVGSVLSDAVVEIYAGPSSSIRYVALQ